MDLPHQHRKTAIRSGSATIVFGLLYFFFATDAADGLSFGMKVFASLAGITASLVCLRLYFRGKSAG